MRVKNIAWGLALYVTAIAAMYKYPVYADPKARLGGAFRGSGTTDTKSAYGKGFSQGYGGTGPILRTDMPDY